jgi:hypothetical protein
MQAQDGRWYVLGYPWLSIDANDGRSALEATRAAVAEWLGVDPDAFDVTVSDQSGAAPHDTWGAAPITPTHRPPDCGPPGGAIHSLRREDLEYGRERQQEADGETCHGYGQRTREVDLLPAPHEPKDTPSCQEDYRRDDHLPG